MKSKVKITADEAGNVIIRSQNNPDYGYIKVEQTRTLIDDTGFARRKKLVTIVSGIIEDLRSFGWTANEEVDGRIVIKESLKPFNKKFPERDLKIAGESGITCTKDGQDIYRKHYFSLDGEGKDILIEHTNGTEIEDFYAANKTVDGNVADQEQVIVEENFDL